MVFAFVLGVAASAALLITQRIEAYALLLPAGGVAAWLVTDRRRGLGGLLAGVILVFGGFAAYAITSKLSSCAGTECSGLSSPAFTMWISIGFLLVGIVLAAAGYWIGRLARRLRGRLRPPAVVNEA
jgi:hypothetical protein